MIAHRIGADPSDAQTSEWSVETHVRAGCPPIFLVQAEDDPISDPHNILVMADACRRAGVPVELHRLVSGGHGFGMGASNSPAGTWPAFFTAWLKSQRMLG
uniref:alpha/beta hydrolase n=1 Tax=Sphingomonas bacterium TaxID=1895847 RepID=UPI003418E229